MPIYEKGSVRINYTEMGSGFPLLIIPGGGLNSTIAGLDVKPGHPFNAQKEFSNAFRCIVADLRNSPPGSSSGPVEIDRPWDSYTDDQVGLMDHLGIKKFMVLGYCIGQPMIWNLIKRVGDRVVAAVLTQPSGFRPELPTQFYDNNMAGWGPALVKKRPEITMDQVSQFLTNMYTKRADFVFTVDRDFVRNCKTPILVAPDDSPPHPYKVAMEVAMLAPNSQVTLYPWKVSPETVPHAVRHIRMFLEANRPAMAATQSMAAAD
ncbi:MAG TPA: alpha/beta hydrolase [Reyranella sp.]|nr:alpha/beta hydrolase [Reyranella sp.]